MKAELLNTEIQDQCFTLEQLGWIVENTDLTIVFNDGMVYTYEGEVSTK